MVDRYLQTAAEIIAVFSAAGAALWIFRKRMELEFANKEKSMLEQLNQIEKLNMEVANLSALYDRSIEDCKRKTEFYSNITHDLRTPLSVILGAIQLLERKRGGLEDDDGTHWKTLRIIKYNCYRMLRLVNNLLDLSKIEAGFPDLKPVNCDLDLLLEEIIQSVMPYAAEKGLSLDYGKSPEPIKTAVDIEKMERVILNLLSNSIKFTKPGGIIKVSSCRSDGRIFISVKDSGVGIPAEVQEKIFGRFRQAGGEPLVENQGSGIGLSLVKSFIDLHNGDIKVISEKGRGCEFIISLPATHIGESSGGADLDNYFARIKEAASIEFSGFQNNVAS